MSVALILDDASSAATELSSPGWHVAKNLHLLLPGVCIQNQSHWQWLQHKLFATDKRCGVVMSIGSNLSNKRGLHKPYVFLHAEETSLRNEVRQGFASWNLGGSRG